MKPEFNITVPEFKIIDQLEGAWTTQDYKNLLEIADFEGVNDIPKNELFDYLTMVLQDLEPDESAALVLEYRLGDTLTHGQIENISHDIQKEPLWEEYQDMSLHEELFNITALLYKIYNGKFPKPNAAKIQLDIEPLNKPAKEELNDCSEAFICRVLCDGMDAHSILYRLFDEKIESLLFKEAEHIIWQYNTAQKGDTTISITLTTGLYWVDELKYIKSFESNAYNDKILNP